MARVAIYLTANVALLHVLLERDLECMILSIESSDNWLDSLKYNYPTWQINLMDLSLHLSS